MTTKPTESDCSRLRVERSIAVAKAAEGVVDAGNRSGLPHDQSCELAAFTTIKVAYELLLAKLPEGEARETFVRALLAATGVRVELLDEPRSPAVVH